MLFAIGWWISILIQICWLQWAKQSIDFPKKSIYKKVTLQRCTSGCKTYYVVNACFYFLLSIGWYDLPTQTSITRIKQLRWSWKNAGHTYSLKHSLVARAHTHDKTQQTSCCDKRTGGSWDNIGWKFLARPLCWARTGNTCVSSTLYHLDLGTSMGHTPSVPWKLQI